jgi:hypothetical protein
MVGPRKSLDKSKVCQTSLLNSRRIFSLLQQSASTTNRSGGGGGGGNLKTKGDGGGNACAAKRARAFLVTGEKK